MLGQCGLSVMVGHRVHRSERWVKYFSMVTMSTVYKGGAGAVLRDVVQKNLVDSVELVSRIERRFGALQNSTFCVGLSFSKSVGRIENQATRKSGRSCVG